MYLCERMLGESDLKAVVSRRRAKNVDVGATSKGRKAKSSKIKVATLNEDKRRIDSDSRSAAALQGAFIKV